MRRSSKKSAEIAVVEIHRECDGPRELGPVIAKNDPQTDPPTHRVLVIEADAVQRALLVRALENSGYIVDALDSPDRGLDAFQRSPYGVVLLYCDDPQIRGFETAAALRKLDSDSKHTPIIALTANIGQKYRRQRKAAGIDDYLQKPLQRDRLELILSRYAPTSNRRSGSSFLSLDKHRLAELRDLTGGDLALLSELIDLYLTTTPEMIGEMRRSSEDGDPIALAAAAHKLKGTSGQMGASNLHEICATIETLASAGALEGVDSLLPDVSLAFENSVRDLRSLAIALQNGEDLPDTGPGGKTGAASRDNVPQTSDVLIAEDDVLMARFLANTLTTAGFHVTHVTTGRLAVEALREKNFAVVVLDVNIPELDGYGVLSEIRRGLDSKVPVTFISSRHQEQDILRAFDLGADDYLTKPFNPMEVVARVRRLARQGTPAS
jgi:DNA-binding response OmpR family regulator